MVPMFVRMLPSDHSGGSYQSDLPSKIQKSKFNHIILSNKYKCQFNQRDFTYRMMNYLLFI